MFFLIFLFADTHRCLAKTLELESINVIDAEDDGVDMLKFAPVDSIMML